MVANKTKAKADTNKNSKTKTKVKTSTKTGVKAKKAPMKTDMKPKIRIQKVPGLAALPSNRDLVIDLSELKRRNPTEVPAATAINPSAKFYSDEDDDSLELPGAEAAAVLDNEETNEEEVPLSLGALEDELPKTGARDYAAEAVDSRPAKADLMDKLYTPPADGQAPATLNQPKNTHGKIYFKLALTFAIIVVALVASVLYFTTVKTTIVVNLKNETVSDEMPLTIVNLEKDQQAPDLAVGGMVKEIEAEQNKVFSVTGTEVIGEEVVGKVTMYNKYNKSQPLVATTRLLSASGKLYRLKNSINIPAGGQMEVEIYADQPVKESVVGAEKFTLPGLWEGLQEKIYAEAKEGDIKYGQQTKKVVTEATINESLKNLEQALFDKVKADVDNTYSDNNRRIVRLVTGSATSSVDAKAGQERDDFNGTIKARFEIVTFNDEAAKVMAEKKLKAGLPNDKSVISFAGDSLSYELIKLADDKKSAELKMTFTAEVAPGSVDTVIDKKKITSLSDGQLRAYLDSIKEIDKDYKIQYFPSFIQKTPSLVDRITVETAK